MSIGWHLRATIVTAALAVAASGETPPGDARAGQTLFEHYCRTCHTIGGGRRVGPDLRDVGKRRERNWLVRFIDDPSAMLQSDPIARRLLGEFDGLAMASSGLRREEIDDVLAYLESASREPIAAPTIRPHRRLFQPRLPLEEIRLTWEKYGLPAASPDVTWRDVRVATTADGKLQIIDPGGSEVAVFGLGAPVVDLRLSPRGLLHVLTRSGWLATFDLRSEPPVQLAEVRGCFEGASLETSADGEELVARCAVPAQAVVFAAHSLEPLTLRPLVDSDEMRKLEEASPPWAP